MGQLLGKLKYQYRDFFFNTKLLSTLSVVKYYCYSYFLRRPFVTVKLNSKKLSELKIKIRCRNGVDRNVLDNVFNQQYHTASELFLNKKNPVILDLGSNIGCTVMDFKLRYPEAIVYGYEMDIDNYNLAMTNCVRFSNVHLFNKAVWIKRGNIVYSRNNQPDAYSITNEQNNLSLSVASLSIGDIIKDNNIARIDYLKMDIEGAELNILDDADLTWLKPVQSFNIEFHDVQDSMMEKYSDLLKANGFSVEKSKNHWSALIGTRS